MRGAHAYGYNNYMVSRGSPPHARGPLRCSMYYLSSSGITPACAGPTALCFDIIEQCQDHPRMRGAHFWLTTAFVVPMGSPPHARGPLHDCYIFLCKQRITPACAGPT